LINRANINDVASAAGVSRATVSQVLRGTGRISPETRSRVLAVMKEIGYVYNRAAANLRAGHSTTVGIAVPELTNPFFAELVAGANRVLEAAGYFATIVNTEDDPGRQARFITMLEEHRLGGSIVCPSPNAPLSAGASGADGLPPTVTVLRHAVGGAFDYVGVDNAAGLFDATNHLIGLGHRAIGFVGGLKGSRSREERLAGWRQALGAAGIAAGTDWDEPTEATIAAGSHGIARLLQRLPQLTAVVCHQDIVACGVTIGLRKRGLVPGRDLSVVGFDDIASAQEWDPPLTSMSVTPATLGGEAARMLLSRIGEPDSPMRSIILRPRLMLRGSTAAPPAG
jgi:LacI family transcriptional regulator